MDREININTETKEIETTIIQKWYAIVGGDNAILCDTWSVAQKYVLGKRVKHKSFEIKEDALKFIEGYGVNKNDIIDRTTESVLKQKERMKKEHQKRNITEFDLEEYLENSNDVNIVVQTTIDEQNRIGHYQYMLLYKEHCKIIEKDADDIIDNSNMGLHAMLDAVAQIKLREKRICVFTTNNIGFQNVLFEEECDGKMKELFLLLSKQENHIYSMVLENGEKEIERIIQEYKEGKRNRRKGNTYQRANKEQTGPTKDTKRKTVRVSKKDHRQVDKAFNVKQYLQENNSDVNILMAVNYNRDTKMGSYKCLLLYKEYKKFIEGNGINDVSSNHLMVVGLKEAMKHIKVKGKNICVISGTPIGFKTALKGKSVNIEEIMGIIKTIEENKNKAKSICIKGGTSMVKREIIELTKDMPEERLVKQQLDATIRSAIKEDYEDVLRLIKKLRDSHIKLRPDIYKENEEPLSYENFIDMVEKEESFIADYEGIIVGILNLMHYYEESPYNIGRDVLYVSDLIVDEKYQGVGVGTKLIEKAKEVKEERRYDVLELDVYEKNTDAYSLYLKNGFQPRLIRMELR